jgi:predicted GNAT superfamily acetyltransferase
MKLRKRRKPADANAPVEETRDGILIRPCHGIGEFEACISVERQVWKSLEVDIIPIPLFVVASETGGQVLGAFHGKDLVGFTLAIAGWRARKPFLHSHMTAVLDGHRDRGIGRRLKLFQREDALARGIALVEWTFDPFVTKNAYFNFMRLGAIARRYLPNVYGITTSPLHGSLPTDRLVAEWHLRSNRVLHVLAGKQTKAMASKRSARITIPSIFEELRENDPSRARQLQSHVREDFLKWLGRGYIATTVEKTTGGTDYILEPWSSS